jgi:hypothetical protein
MRDRRLADSAAVGEVAGADRALGTQLAKDRQPRRVGRCLKEQDVRIGRALHALNDID